MPRWLIDLISAVVAAVLTAVIIGFLRRRSLARREAALQEGKQTSFEAFIRGKVAPYPRRWRYGWVNVGLGTPSWKPRFSLRRRPVVLPVSARIESIRHVAGFMEMFATNPDCSVFHVRAEDVDFELAVMAMDVASALRALQSGSGGGWRVADPETQARLTRGASRD